MLRKVVGWFAVLAGLLLAVDMGDKVYRKVAAGGLGGPEYVQVAMGSILALGGLVLVVFGLRRLRRREAPVRKAEDEASQDGPSP